MASILEKIVLRKQREVAEAIDRTPLATIELRAANTAPPRQFFAAVVSGDSSAPTRVIAEIKRKSPSAGVIRDEFDPLAIARQYHAAGARAISCLTDEVDFGGELGFIEKIREEVELPVLRKDFIVDAYQVWESRAASADAILLIAECLDTETMLACRALASELGMSTLVEVHTEENLHRVLDSMSFPRDGDALLGINNRDLARMETNLAHTGRMLDAIDGGILDRDVVVSESGITTRADLATLRESGVGIVLVGEHLMSRTDPGEALRELLA